MGKPLIYVIVAALLAVIVAAHMRPHHGGMLGHLVTAIHGHR